jgi:DNA-binding MarR family transcriptional regulator/GNAT superfamily N-acetyltransferase
MTMDVETERSVDAVRRFNRFYTPRIGALGEGHLDTPFSLTEARVIYELAQRETATATGLGQELGVDAGYLSRILRGFQDRGLLDRRPSETDARQSRLSLTDEGRDAFAQLNATAHRDIAAMLHAVPAADRARLVAAMGTIEEVLAGRPEPHEPYVLRDPRPGDLGWVVQSHGELYAREYGWNAEFEALTAEIVAAYVRNFRPERERCWIAERGGENVGSIFVVRQSDEVARLRLLLVDPRARGLGIGARLVDECIRFSRGAGYRTLALWTNDVLHSARRIYIAAGFHLVHEEPHHGFGHDLVSQTWELAL